MPVMEAPVTPVVVSEKFDVAPPETEAVKFTLNVTLAAFYPFTVLHLMDLGVERVIGTLTLGQITFRREKYDDSLDALSRAAKLKPQSAEIQNSLGVTLTHKGLRDQAEQAYRRAIVINPSYADAHYNLAVFYGTKDTSFVNLARWHYQRAIAGGHAANPDLEKVLDSKAGTDGTK